MMTTIDHLEAKYGMSKFFSEKQNESFFEIPIEAIGISVDHLLKATKKIESKIGLRGWRAYGQESETYKGFSLCYNPKLGIDPFATLGDYRLNQVFSVNMGSGGIEELQNSYYDTYSFNRLHPIVSNEYEFLIKKFVAPLIRSRVSYIFPHGDIYNYPFHKDEPIYHNLRINIPLQTSDEYILEIDGNDEWGNCLKLKKHLAVGKIYLWNTRIPHRVLAVKQPSTDLPRIHVVLGFCPWFNIVNNEYVPNENFGINPFKLFNQGKILKLNQGKLNY